MRSVLCSVWLFTVMLTVNRPALHAYPSKNFTRKHDATWSSHVQMTGPDDGRSTQCRHFVCYLNASMFESDSLYNGYFDADASGAKLRSLQKLHSKWLGNDISLATSNWPKRYRQKKPYTCKCQTGNAGHFARKFYKNYKNGSEPIVFEAVPKTVTVSQGDFVVLPCAANGTTPVSWMRDNKVLFYNGEHYRLLKDNSLMIRNARKWHSGGYHCAATDSRMAFWFAHVIVTPGIGKVCGKMKVKHSVGKRMVGGKIAAHGAHPWMAHILLPDGNQSGWFCGGSLLSHRVVATAAHCLTKFDKINPIVVRLGKHFYKGAESTEQQSVGVGFVIHPWFSEITLENDIALIFLKGKVAFTDYVRPICLPPSDNFFSWTLAENQFGKVVGWGNLNESNPHSGSKRLSYMQLPLLNRRKCYEEGGFVNRSSAFCAGSKLKASRIIARGDSGGPFELRRKGRTYLAGLASFTFKKGFKSYFTNVAQYLRSNKDGQVGLVAASWGLDAEPSKSIILLD